MFSPTAIRFDPYRNLFRAGTATRLGKLLSPRYVAARLNVALYEAMHPDHPWLTRAAIEWLDRHLSTSMNGFEWGSGTGTPWLARRTGTLVSVEHDPIWAERVRTDLARAGLRNVELRVVPESDYVAQMRAFPDARFDWVLVDGLFRDEALLASLPKLEPGGFLVFDNVNWYLPSNSRTPHSRSLADGPATPIFAEALRDLASWETRWTTNGINDTAVFVKPIVEVR